MTDLSLPPEIERGLAGRPDADRLAHTWRLVAGDAALPDDAPTTTEAWADIESWLGLAARPLDAQRRAPATDRPPAHTAHGPRAVRWARPAALLGLVLAAALGGDTWWARQSVVTEAPAGGRVNVALADGSRVLLNSGSRLTVARGLGAPRPWRSATRAVALDGEAFFAVARDQRRPFVVETFNADVTVLGTRFNVRAWSGERNAATRVALESGRVRVAARNDEAVPGAGAVVLAPGEATVVSAGGVAPPAVAAVGRAAAWRAGGFAVEGLPLGDVLVEVGRRFGTDVRAADGVPLSLPVTLYYRAGVTADEVLHDLALAAGLRYRPFQGGFEVAPAEGQTP